MDLIVIKYDYKDGELLSGTVLANPTEVKILGRNIKQVFGVENRLDRLDGLTGGGIEMLMIIYRNREYGIINMDVEELTACLCGVPTPKGCVLSLDGCELLLDDCVLQLN